LSRQLHANYIQTIFFFSLREQKSFGRNRRIETTRHITAATIIFLLWGGRKKKKKKKHLKILENQIEKKNEGDKTDYTIIRLSYNSWC
jgi:hypothetical protein